MMEDTQMIIDKAEKELAARIANALRNAFAVSESGAVRFAAGFSSAFSNDILCPLLNTNQQDNSNNVKED